MPFQHPVLTRPRMCSSSLQSERPPPPHPCTGKEPKPRLSPLSGWQMVRRKCLNSSDNFPVRGKLLGRVRGIRTEPLWRRRLPVCGAAPLLGALPAWKAAWVFSYCCGPWQENPGSFAPAQGKVRTGLRPQLSPLSWNLRELNRSSLGSDEARRAGLANLQVTERGVQR